MKNMTKMGDFFVPAVRKNCTLTLYLLTKYEYLIAIALFQGSSSLVS